jgi:ketosteroid isomerase-like protein
MNIFRMLRTVLVAAGALSLGVGGAAAQSAPVDAGKVAAAVKADVAQLLVDYNARDPVKTASHDAPDIVQMVHGSPNVVGQAADLASDRKQFAANPMAHTTLSNETVDVAASGEMAVYRATYDSSFTNARTKKTRTETGNYVAGYRLQPDGSWKIQWAIYSNTRSRP